MILNGEQILNRMKAESDKLYVTPLFPGQLDLTAVSIDLHLGYDFLTFDTPRVPIVDPVDDLEPPLTTEHYVPWGQPFTLHPQAFVLAAVLQYIALPKNLAAHVLGRSTWARVGLVIAMATLVHPGYAGCLTLELQNLGSAPIKLRPGLRIAQLVIEECYEIGELPPGQITCATAPQGRRLLSCADTALLNIRVWNNPTNETQ